MSRPFRLFILAWTPLAAAGAGACSWNLNYLDSGGGVAPSADSAVSSDASTADAATTDADAGSASTDVSDALTESEVFFGDGGNLIQNPSCENGVADWSTIGETPLASSTKFVHPGDTASCWAYDRVHEQPEGGLSSFDGPKQDIEAVVVPGHEYSASAWVLWAPPLDGAAVSESDSLTDEAGIDSDASVDGSADASFDASDSDTGTGGYEQQNAYITVKQTCDDSVTYVRIAQAIAVAEEMWTQVTGPTMPLSVPTNCSTLTLELYIEGPDIGLDLYVDEVTLLLVE